MITESDLLSGVRAIIVFFKWMAFWKKKKTFATLQLDL